MYPVQVDPFLQDSSRQNQWVEAIEANSAKVLCVNSAADVDWLVDKFDLDLSLVARLGGHSQPRTHRGKERFPGMTITYALIQMLEKACTRSTCHWDHLCDVFSVDGDSLKMNRFSSARSQLHFFQVCQRCVYSVYISPHMSLLILHHPGGWEDRSCPHRHKGWGVQVGSEWQIRGGMWISKGWQVSEGQGDVPRHGPWKSLVPSACLSSLLRCFGHDISFQIRWYDDQPLA